MEKGYWSGLEIPRGAWEMRWLAYRFRNLGTQLEETVRRLVEAERRAMLGLSAGLAPSPAAEKRPARVEDDASPVGRGGRLPREAASPLPPVALPLSRGAGPE